MRKIALLSSLVFLSMWSSAQIYRLDRIYLTQNSLPKPVNITMEVFGDELVFTSISIDSTGNDTSITREKIIKNKGSFIKTQISGGAANYDIYLSPDKQEKKNGIYIVSCLFAYNSGERKTIFFKGKLAD